MGNTGHEVTKMVIIISFSLRSGESEKPYTWSTLAQGEAKCSLLANAIRYGDNKVYPLVTDLELTETP